LFVQGSQVTRILRETHTIRGNLTLSR